MSSFFQFKGFKVFQGEAGLKVNTDGVLLGSLAQHRNPQNILDIGSGTGIVGAILAYKFPNAHSTWLDINKTAYQASLETAKIHPNTEHITVVNAAIQDFSSQKKFDLIVSNPPYFKSHTAKNANREEARQQGSLSYLVLIEKSRDLLEAKGEIWIIFPSEHFSEIHYELIRNRLYCKEKIDILDQPNAAPKRTVIAASKTPKILKASQLILFERNGKIHPNFKDLTGNYYQTLPQRN